jgi:thermolysin
MRRIAAALVVLSSVAVGFEDRGSAQQALADVRAWDTFVTAAERSGQLRVRSVSRDPSLPARLVERFQQYHEGVPIWGADVVRDSERGVPVSVFGILAPSLTLSVQPTIDGTAARAAFLGANGREVELVTAPELVIVNTDAGYRLAYMAVVAEGVNISRVMVDGHTGAEIERHPEVLTQSAVGTGTGVLGDQKKLSVSPEAGVYFTDDRHRPPVLRTFDFRGNTARAVSAINGVTALLASDRASDSDNLWTDAGVVDAHVNVGWTYDYYYKRFGRRGLDDRDRPITTVVNAVTPQAALTLPASLSLLVDNAFWCGQCGPGGTGLMYFGSGVPANIFNLLTGQTVAPLAGALDVAAHELTHGVVDSTSRLALGNEPGALNEAFADMMGTSVEFFYQAAGNGRGQADYLIGEDVYRALRPGSIDGARSLSNPLAFGFPDHYSRRYTGTLDDGGVHINAGIPGQAFYLAIEGGTNRTSGVAVQGVGAANREQIEKVFYRAFTLLMPASSTFATARAATTQAARDLYGAGGAVERAVTQAWMAVGVL